MLAFLVVNKGFALVLHADDSENQEILTVPIQQLARVYTMEGDTLTEQQKETLFEILPEEALKRYNPKVSDPVKVDFELMKLIRESTEGSGLIFSGSIPSGISMPGL